MDADEWDERYGAAELVWGAAPNRFVEEYCQGLTAGRAADVACGEGRNALWLARRGWTVLGTDYSPVAVARARELAEAEHPDVQARLRFEVADVTTTMPGETSHDLVVVCYLHLPPADIATVFERAARAVRLGGHLLVVGHDRRNLREGVSGPQDESLLYSPDAVRAAISPVDGIAVLHADTVERPTDEGVALDTLFFATRR